ncbi:TPA: hypothetical protein ACJIWE_000707 [Enterobacter roggenkampii]
MNEQANKILVDLLQKASNGIDAAVSFSQAQIPDVIHQLLVWNFASSICAQVFGLLVVIACPFPTKAILSRYAKAKVKDETWVIDQSFDYTKSMSFSAFCALVMCAVAFFVGVLMVATNFDWLKIWLAPKLYLIEYAASLVK